ncbi:MAG: ABC transporter permease [Alkalinema sp. RL_2_19]|nr:ABC transporter permease [Alkalinema sp. RL_2_19]
MEGAGQLIVQLVWAIGLLGIATGIALWQRVEDLLGMALSTVRGALQLFVLSYLLTMLIVLEQPLVSLLGIILFGIVAALLLRSQLAVKLPLLPLTLMGLGLGLAVPLIYVVVFVLRPAAWYDPQILLPLSGLVLANASSGGLIAANRLIQSLTYNTNNIETALCLGNTATAAIAHYRRDAIRAAILPHTTALSIVGLGTMPTLMAGSLLGGIEPFQAAIWQLVVMLMSLVATLITVLLLCAGIQRQFFSQADQLQQW